jgi:MFS family permease
MVSCFWAAEANSFRSFVAARVLCGLCMAPMEALVPASIADIWSVLILVFSPQACFLTRCFRFVHERGFRTAVFNLGVLGGINLAVPIGTLAVEIHIQDYLLTLISCCNHRIQLLSHRTPRYGGRFCPGAYPGLLLDARVRVHERSLKHRHRRDECEYGSAFSKHISLTLLDRGGREGNTGTTRALAQHGTSNV